jgi:hypothetical protein
MTKNTDYCWLYKKVMCTCEHECYPCPLWIDFQKNRTLRRRIKFLLMFRWDSCHKCFIHSETGEVIHNFTTLMWYIK